MLKLLLLPRGADPTLRDRDGESMQHHADRAVKEDELRAVPREVFLVLVVPTMAAVLPD